MASQELPDTPVESEPLTRASRPGAEAPCLVLIPKGDLNEGKLGAKTRSEKLKWTKLCGNHYYRATLKTFASGCDLAM